MIEPAEKRDFFGGLSEEERRRLPRSPEATRYRELIRAEHSGRAEGPVNPQRIEIGDTALLTRLVKEKAIELGADLVGTARIERHYIYKGQDIPQRYAVSLAMEMRKDKIQEATGPDAGTEYFRVYYELGWTTIRLAEYIRSLGYTATAHHPLGSNVVLHVPVAVSAGIVQLGRLGVGLSPEFGPRFRLGTVTTDLPLVEGEVSNGYRAEFCYRCLACWRACPAGAIARELSQERGLERYLVDWAKCRAYMNYHYSCGICLKVCPYDRAMEKMRRTQRSD